MATSTSTMEISYAAIAPRRKTLFANAGIIKNQRTTSAMTAKLLSLVLVAMIYGCDSPAHSTCEDCEQTCLEIRKKALMIEEVNKRLAEQIKGYNKKMLGGDEE